MGLPGRECEFTCNAKPVSRIFLAEVFTENKLTRRSLLSAFSLLPTARLLSGQQQQSPPAEQVPKYSADVKVVNLFATVRDKSGKIVKDLTKDDFVLDEEGRPQTIKFFERESSLPLNLGMMVDTSGSQARVLGDERSAGLKFFDQILREIATRLSSSISITKSNCCRISPRRAQKLDKRWTCCRWAEPQQQTQQQGGTIRRAAITRKAAAIPAEATREAAIRPGRRYPQGAARMAAAPKCTTPSCWLPTT